MLLKCNKYVDISIFTQNTCTTLQQAIYKLCLTWSYIVYNYVILQHHQWNRLSGTMEVMEVNVLYNQTVSYLDNIIFIADRLTGKILAR